MACRFEFVLANGNSGKANLQDRALIRSRCMQGKNKKANSRRSLQAAARAAHSAPWAKTQFRPQTCATAGAIPTPELFDSRSLDSVCGQSKPDLEESSDHLQHDGCPKLDSEILQFVHQDSVVYPREFAFNFNAFNRVKVLSSPLFNVLYFDDMGNDRQLQLVQDGPFRHAIVLLVSAYKEYIQQRQLSDASYKHHRDTVASLIARLSEEPSQYLIDTTLYIINVLATIALWLGRHDEIVSHVLALKRIVNLRGGRDFLRNQPFLTYHLQCLDLASSMNSGEDLSFDDGMSIFIVPAPGVNKELANIVPNPINGLLDQRVTSVYGDLLGLVAQINAYWARSRRLGYSEFRLSYGPILRRLLALRDSIDDAVSECFRLGLLAFLTTVTFRIPTTTPSRPSEASQFAYLTSSYREACRNIMSTNPPSNILAFWLLTVGAMTVFMLEDDDWLTDKFKEVAKTLFGVPPSWEDARACLEHILWIKSIHDEMGRKVYTKFMTGVSVDRQ